MGLASSVSIMEKVEMAFGRLERSVLWLGWILSGLWPVGRWGYIYAAVALPCFA
jgi:hypothetical protein